MSYTFKDLAYDVLLSSDKPLKVDEMWKIAEKNSLTLRLLSIGKTPTRTLGAQIYTDIKKGNSKFVQISKRPAMFF